METTQKDTLKSLYILHLKLVTFCIDSDILIAPFEKDISVRKVLIHEGFAKIFLAVWLLFPSVTITELLFIFKNSRDCK